MSKPGLYARDGIGNEITVGDKVMFWGKGGWKSGAKGEEGWYAAEVDSLKPSGAYVYTSAYI